MELVKLQRISKKICFFITLKIRQNSKIRVLIEQVKDSVSIGKSQHFTKIEISEKLIEGSIVECIITDVSNNISRANLLS